MSISFQSLTIYSLGNLGGTKPTNCKQWRSKLDASKKRNQMKIIASFPDLFAKGFSDGNSRIESINLHQKSKLCVFMCINSLKWNQIVCFCFFFLCFLISEIDLCVCFSFWRVCVLIFWNQFVCGCSSPINWFVCGCSWMACMVLWVGFSSDSTQRE